MKKLFLALAIAATLCACKDEIGDSCGYDADCSPNGDRNCDRNQPGGYCLILGCVPDECPSEAVCVEFTAPCPELLNDEGDAGAEYEALCDEILPNRGRTYCLRKCTSDKDCRSEYECFTPTKILESYLSAEIIDIDIDNPDLGYCAPKKE